MYDYEHDPNNAAVSVAKNISPYLVDGPDTVIRNRSRPLSSVPEIRFGNQPIDGGNLILSEAERNELLQSHPEASKWVRLYLGSHEFINGERRWCLWLRDAEPAELRATPPVRARVEGVQQFRLASDRAATRDLASTPSLFAFVSHTERQFLLIPSVSSERRRFIPMGFMPPHVIASNLCLVVADATPYHFGVLSSTLHMAWVQTVCGRLKSDYRYSNKLVYNNFPWPDPTPEQRAAVEARAQAVLDARAEFPTSTLADLYDPVAMPPALVKAHDELDKAVEKCYRKEKFTSDRERVEFLFARYEQLAAPLAPPPKRRRKGDGGAA